MTLQCATRALIAERTRESDGQPDLKGSATHKRHCCLRRSSHSTTDRALSWFSLLPMSTRNTDIAKF